MARISIMMAVYNAEKYLTKSISSVLSQTHKDWELLCVDDCSKDNSLDILNDYAQKDTRIRVWHQPENKGQAIARNIALEHATGEIVCFLDADDWFSDDALELIDKEFEAHPNTDIVLFRCRYHEDDKTWDYADPEKEVLTGEEAFVKSLTWEIHGVYAVRQAIHKEVPYDTTCRHYSDDNTTRIHYHMAREVRHCDAVYHYLQHGNSVSHNTTISRFDYLRANQSMRRQLMELNCSKANLALYENQRWLNLLTMCIFFVKNRSHYTAEERRYCIEELHKAWSSIDTSSVGMHYKWKPGYWPLKGHWWLFRIQFEIFARLRILFNRDV